MRALTAAWLALLPAIVPHAIVPHQDEDPLLVDLIDNGDFEERAEGVEDARARLVPWWVTTDSDGAGVALERTREGDAVWLHTPAGRIARQPLAGHAPLAEHLVVSGRVRGAGVVELVEGGGETARFPVTDGDFEVTGAEVADLLGRPPRPRFELRLVGGEGGAAWTGIRGRVALPRPSPEELRSVVLARLDRIFANWFEHGMEPPESDTGFVHHLFDAVSGERIRTIAGGPFPLFESLLDALVHHEDWEHENGGWRARLETFLEAWLARGFHPETGLPCRWLLDEGRADADRWVEPHADLRFLLDVAERGPKRFRAPALAAAHRMGETIVAVGVLPDGNVAARYRARDGAITLDALPLRRLDTPAQLARLGAATDDPRFVQVARNALAEFEFTHHWSGTWRQIDPGFDDDFGIYGGRAVTMLEAYPDEPVFRALVRSGYDHFAPLWRDTLRFGGTVAVDQVRCWELLLDFAALEPEVLPELSRLLPAALRHHVKGTQYRNGAWGDVTMAHFDPQAGIQVGDLPGTPSNLLEGLALCHDERLAIDLEEVRALYLAVLLTTDEHYLRPYGYLLTQSEQAGQNMAGGGLRLLAGLTEMLARLP